MPTTRPRHFVTETDELREALDEAAQRWPGLGRSQLIVRLALEGQRACQAAIEQRRRKRLEAIERTSGIFSGMYKDDYLQKLRDEWPD